MNRRKAILGILITGIGGLSVIAGYKWYEWNKIPDVEFLEENKNSLNALCELIIPSTDSPGSIHAGVGDFIILMIKDCTELKNKNKFIDGLKDLLSYSMSRYNKDFIQCSKKEQISILKKFEKDGEPMKGLMGKIQTKFLGVSFFQTLKEYTVKGYCTSEIGATKALAYIAIPGSYNGHTILALNQKSWATK